MTGPLPCLCLCCLQHSSCRNPLDSLPHLLSPFSTFLTFRVCKRPCAGKVQCVMELAAKPNGLSSIPSQRESTLVSCPLISTHAPWHTCATSTLSITQGFLWSPWYHAKFSPHTLLLRCSSPALMSSVVSGVHHLGSLDDLLPLLFSCHLSCWDTGVLKAAIWFVPLG